MEKIPTITINSPSPSYNNNHNKQLGFNSSGKHSKKEEYLFYKLDTLRDKICRYYIHMLFLEKRIKENVIPNGLKLKSRTNHRKS